MFRFSGTLPTAKGKTSMNNLKEIRHLCGLTQRELAKRAGMRNFATISLAEQRGLRLSKRQEKKIRAVLIAVLHEHFQKCERYLKSEN